VYHLSNCSTAARVGMGREIYLQQQFPGDAPAAPDEPVQRQFPGDAPAAPDEPVTSSGTGFFVSTDGLLLTANHMVDEAKVIKVTLSDGSIAEAKVEAADPANDLALLSIGKKSPAHLSLAAPRSAKLGQKVFTIGFPATAILGQDPQYTDGAISSLSGVKGAAPLLQISVPIQPGNSGGPLVNENGEVVGIITASAAVEFFFAATSTLPQNVNWAIKSEYAGLLFDQPAKQPPAKDRDAILENVKKALCFIQVTE